MSTQKNLITLCFATVFTLGLAACGGGGGGDGAPVTGMPDDPVTDAGRPDRYAGRPVEPTAPLRCGAVPGMRGRPPGGA